MHKHYIIAAITTLLLMPRAHADFVGLHFGTGIWQQDFSGQLTKNNNSVNLQSDLALDDASGQSFYVAFEHPVPFFPNVRFEYTELKDTVTTTLQNQLSFGNTIFNSGEELTSQVDLSHEEYIVYYQVLDNWLNLDLGLSVKHFTQGIQIQSITNGNQENTDLDSYIPMLYAYGQFDLPFTGLSAGMGGSFVEYSGSSIRDWRAQIRYEMEIGLGIEAGYRALELNFDDIDNINSDTSFTGIFINATYHF